MANPNKTVLNARRKMGGFPPKPAKPLDDFTQWVCDQARSGAMFNTIEEAKKAFNESKQGEPK